MKLRALTGLGLGATAAALVGLLAAGPLTAPQTGSAPDVATRSAPVGAGATSGQLALPSVSPAPATARARAALPVFTDCAALRRWYVEAALPDVGPWGFEGPLGYRGAMFATLDVHAPVPLNGRADTAVAVGSSSTGTNVQELGVDEPDLAKTDGRVLVRVVGRDLVVVDVTGDEARQVSRTRLPGPRLDAEELLLLGDSVLVVGQRGGYYGYRGPVFDRLIRPWASGDVVTHLVRVDLTTPEAPRVLRHERLDGTPVAVRSYPDGTVRVVLRTGFPALDFVAPNRHRTRREATRVNRQVVRRAPLSDWLPQVRTGDGSGGHRLVDCSQIRHPRTPSGFGTISVLTLPGGDPAAASSTAITAAGDLVYSSVDRLYVATMRSGWWEPAGSVRARPPLPRTALHAFALDGTATTYLASGTVPGTVRDRWSFDEHQGVLRVATALGRSWRPRENAVSTLVENGDRIRVAGSVDGLGRHENIESVRWFDDLAVVVTFRQTDPVYTIDLSQPTSPRLLGALKVPGFSAYLHPVGGDLVLGVGVAATRTGSTRGAQASSFDLSDPRRVTRLASHRFAGRTQAMVADPRAFTYLPDERLALVPLESWRTGSTTVAGLRVGADGRLRQVRSWTLARWWGERTRSLPLGGGRLALVGRAVHIVHAG